MFDYSVKDGSVILSCDNFDLGQTLDCGQAFRWNEDNSGSFRGFYGKLPLSISQENDRFILHNVTEAEFLDVWADYFDLYEDYGEIIRRLNEDPVLSRATAFAPGIRLLRQDREECLISFIISQNNNIPRIKGIIQRLCDIYGSFPTIKEMTGADEETLAPLRAGFRSKYLLDCIQKVTDGTVELDKIASMSLDEASEKLKIIKGVGEKVAKCVLLFGFHKLDAYPVDVWMKRVNERFYPDGLPECTKGIEGIAQQYLFYAIRCGAL